MEEAFDTSSAAPVGEIFRIVQLTDPPTNTMVAALLTLCRSFVRCSIIVRACAENLKAG